MGHRKCVSTHARCRLVVVRAMRHMKELQQVSKEMVRRIGRYLRGVPRLVRWFYLQALSGQVRIQADADHAESVISRKSTTCTLITHSGHNMGVTNNLQPVVATSFVENEFYAITKGQAVR